MNSFREKKKALLLEERDHLLDELRRNAGELRAYGVDTGVTLQSNRFEGSNGPLACMIEILKADGQWRTDEELKDALEANGYMLGRKQLRNVVRGYIGSSIKVNTDRYNRLVRSSEGSLGLPGWQRNT